MSACQRLRSFACNDLIMKIIIKKRLLKAFQHRNAGDNLASSFQAFKYTCSVMLGADFGYVRSCLF